MLRRLTEWSDRNRIGRRLRRSLLENPVSGRAIRSLDRRRMRELEREEDPVERSKRRWREAPPDPGLTWGDRVDGADAARVAIAHGVFGPGRSVLEIGPGYGRILEAVLAAGAEFDRYVGLDLSERNVSHLRAAFSDGRLEFVEGDAETASLDAPVDGAYSFLTFKHLYPSFEAALRNIASQLNPNGVVVFDLIEGDRAYFHHDRTSFVRHYTRETAREIVELAGLEPAGFDRVRHAPGRERLVVVARRPG
jgi:SAM-dependent methyltransferase